MVTLAESVTVEVRNSHGVGNAFTQGRASPAANTRDHLLSSEGSLSAAIDKLNFVNTSIFVAGLQLKDL